LPEHSGRLKDFRRPGPTGGIDRKLLSEQGSADQEALTEVAALITQQACLVDGFHPFRDNQDIDAMCQRDQTFGQARSSFVVDYFINETAVDLESGYRKSA
jgi:hypothetical protein